MQISPTSTNFKAVEYIRTPALERVLSSQKAEVSGILKNAEKELAGNKTKLVISEHGEGLLTHYVDIGKKGLTYIDSAEQEDNILKVFGYTFDKNGDALKHTEYVWCEIPLRTPDVAKRYADLINANPYADRTSNALNKAVITVKALDELI